MEINNYYKILGLGYKFTELALLNKYLKTARTALATENKEELIRARMGYEVLRDETVTQEYNRIYRKYILKEELNFPTVREQQMINAIQSKEKLGSEIAMQVIQERESFRTHFLKFLFLFVVVDLSKIFTLGISGISLISVGLFVLLTFNDQTNLIGSGLLILAGLYSLKRNIEWEISR